VTSSGTRFGRLVVVRRAADAAHRQRRWVCLCTCGQKKTVLQTSLHTGRTRSCGCLHREALARAQLRVTHGETIGGKPSPEWITWRAMHKRCYYKRDIAYPWYGGRGIRVCPRWYSFEHFLRDMGRRPTRQHTIERIDGERNYTPKNCKWATRVEQTRNRSNTRLYQARGVKLTAVEWGVRVGLAASLIARRIRGGWPVERAISTPSRKGQR
jgi:hypothetical protein